MKERIRQSGLKQWQIAEAIGVSEWTLARWLRHEPTPEQAALIESAIEKLAANQNGKEV